MPLPWIKMWLEALDDPKLTRLSLAERGAWWGVLKLAGKCAAGGKIISGGEGLNIDEITEALHIKSVEDRQALESMIAKMEKRGSLIWNEGHVLMVVHYEERQKIPPSSKPEAVAERVRRHRERQKKGGGELVGELAVISKLYEENIGMLTPVAADRLKDISERYPPGWFGEALKEAVAGGARNLKYIEAILERWGVEGFKSPRTKGGEGEQGKGQRAKVRPREAFRGRKW
ncbi:unnamed protein product [marine sediment metagenome]|uniref:DnaB/C C-terminal domain-containing protein n=1 Tax=marine sediment metagenome TaxID=412755 RepID=X1V7W0_9ZZZZ